MYNLPINVFDVYAELSCAYCLGDVLGEYAYRLLLKKIKDCGMNQVWNVDLKRCSGADYYFFGTFIRPLLNNYGEQLPENVALCLSCYIVTDRPHVLSSLSFESEPLSLISDDNSLASIKQYNRFFVLLNIYKREQSSIIEYIGTQEQPLVEMLSYLDTHSNVSIDELKTNLKINTPMASDFLKTLSKRRHVLQMNYSIIDDIDEPIYNSISQILKAGAKNE